MIISHNCISNHGSNGRTIGTLFEEWDKADLAQFYITNEITDNDICNNFYRITDSEALKSFIKRIELGGKIAGSEKQTFSETGNYLKQKIVRILSRRNSFNYIMRNFVWKHSCYAKGMFFQWIEEFSPDIIVFQAGDYAFLYELTYKVATRFKIPIVIFNTEDYYFKDRKKINLLYLYSRRQYKRAFKKLMEYASAVVYNTEDLKRRFESQFSTKGYIIMTSTNNRPQKVDYKNNSIKIVYQGNLGVGRHIPLIEIADILQRISDKLILDIYGECRDSRVLKKLQKCKGINYHGVVSYQEVLRVMRESSLLIHAENFSDFSKWDLAAAFSTKIADCLASGIPFLLYAPDNLACTKYLQKYEAAYVVTEKEKLEPILRKIIYSKEEKNQYIKNALKLVEENHNIEKNRMEMYRILKKAVEETSYESLAD